MGIIKFIKRFFRKPQVHEYKRKTMYELVDEKKDIPMEICKEEQNTPEMGD